MKTNPNIKDFFEGYSKKAKGGFFDKILKGILAKSIK